MENKADMKNEVDICFKNEDLINISITKRLYASYSFFIDIFI